jgi:uncharacterized FlgJ-related protein
MSTTVSEVLAKLASDLTDVANWHEIQAQAADSLAAAGIEKTAAEDVLSEIAFEQVNGKLPPLAAISEVLSKTASYIADLEAKIEDSEQTIAAMKANVEKLAEEQLSGAAAHLIDKGFSREEVGQMANTLSDETLLKLAQSIDTAPHTMGRGAGMARDSLDPLTAFLLS